MTDKTPTTEQVRRVYSLAPVNLVTGGEPNKDSGYAAAQFDRWIANHDREVAANALRRFADVIDPGADSDPEKETTIYDSYDVAEIARAHAETEANR